MRAYHGFLRSMGAQEILHLSVGEVRCHSGFCSYDSSSLLAPWLLMFLLPLLADFPLNTLWLHLQIAAVPSYSLCPFLWVSHSDFLRENLIGLGSHWPTWSVLSLSSCISLLIGCWFSSHLSYRLWSFTQLLIPGLISCGQECKVSRYNT